MSWQDIIKAELTKEGLIKYLQNYDIDVDGYGLSQEDVDLAYNVINNAEYVVNNVSQDKLKEYLNTRNDYDYFINEFYREILRMDFPEEKERDSRKLHREMFPEEALYWDRA
jgi:hypothetical protein